MVLALGLYADEAYLFLAGEYTACDYHHVSTETVQWPLNPLKGEVYQPWDTRQRPVITWDTSKDSAGQLYTLLFQDVGIGPTHSLWMNIQGNDLSTATVRIALFALFLAPISELKVFSACR